MTLFETFADDLHLFIVLPVPLRPSVRYTIIYICEHGTQQCVSDQWSHSAYEGLNMSVMECIQQCWRGHGVYRNRTRKLYEAVNAVTSKLASRASLQRRGSLEEGFDKPVLGYRSHLRSEVMPCC